MGFDSPSSIDMTVPQRPQCAISSCLFILEFRLPVAPQYVLSDYATCLDGFETPLECGHDPVRGPSGLVGERRLFGQNFRELAEGLKIPHELTKACNLCKSHGNNPLPSFGIYDADFDRHKLHTLTSSGSRTLPGKICRPCKLVSEQLMSSQRKLHLWRILLDTKDTIRRDFNVSHTGSSFHLVLRDNIVDSSIIVESSSNPL